MRTTRIEILFQLILLFVPLFSGNSLLTFSLSSNRGRKIRLSMTEGDTFAKGVLYDSEGVIKNCVFCSIVNRTGPARIVDENDEFIVFRTLKPYAEHHLLVCPKRHVTSVHELSGEEDAKMIERMVKFGQKCLDSLEYTEKKVLEGESIMHKYCFHIPPYNSIDHLHLHSIGLGDASMNWFGRLKYWDSTFYCKSAELIIAQLRQGGRKEDSSSGGSGALDKDDKNGSSSGGVGLKSKL